MKIKMDKEIFLMSFDEIVKWKVLYPNEEIAFVEILNYEKTTMRDKYMYVDLEVIFNTKQQLIKFITKI